MNQLIDDFIKFESREELFEAEIQGIKFWHLVRKDIYDEIMKSYSKINNAHYADVYSKNSKIILAKLKQLKYLFKNNPKKKLSSKPLFIMNHQRRVKQGNLFECLYTSKLIKNIEQDYYVYELPHHETHLKPVPEKNIKYTDNLINHYYLKRLKNKLFNIEELSFNDKKNIRILIEKINIQFNSDLSISQWITSINNSLLYYHTLYDHYKNILKEVKPKIIIEVVSYEMSRYVVNKLADEMNIPTVELQHGTMGRNHISYNFPEGLNLATFPKYVFTFGDYWKENTRLPLPKENVISVGSIFYEEKIRDFDKNICDLNIKTRKNILFISQGTIGIDLSKIAVELSNKLNMKEYNITYKLHPGEYERWENDYPWLKNTDIQVIDHNNDDIHFYLSNANILIGVNSTVIFEGIGYKIMTIIVKLPGYNYMENLYHNNLAYLVKNSNEIQKIISNNKRNKFILEDIEFLWKSNSLTNMVNEISKISNIT